MNHLPTAVALVLAAALVASPLAARPAASHSAPVFHPRADPLPLSIAVQTGKTVYLSGMLGVAPDGRSLVPGGIEAETRRTMDLIGEDLKRLGLTSEDVVKCTVFLTDLKDLPAFTAVYASYFKPGRYPARSTLGVSSLIGGAKVEVECVAWKG